MPIKVLAIDDDIAMTDLLSLLLRTNKFDVITANNGMDGIALVKHALPDIVLLDVMMPGMDGFEVCKKLKTDEALSRIPIIFVTALTQGEDEEKGFKLGAVDYILKPISPPILKERVKNHLALMRVSLRLLFFDKTSNSLLP